MTRFIIGRAAACGGALVLAVGAGCIVAPAANADGLGTGSTGTLTGTVAQTVGGVTGGTGVTTTSPSSSTSPSTTTSAGTGSTPSTAVDTGTGTSAGTGSVVGGGTGIPVVDTTVPTTTSTVQDLVNPVATAGGAGALSGVTTGVSSGSGQLVVTVGQTGDGGSLATIALGGQGTSSVGATGSAGTDGTSGVTGTTGAASGAAADLLGLHVRRSLSTVYPVKDGYRDEVAFTLDGLTSSGQPQAVDGAAVLKRGTTTVQRWTIGRTDQVLRWNGFSGSKVVPGTYRLIVGARDAAGHAFSAVESVKVSGKRLVASTRRVRTLAISGTHKMVAEPRAGLSRGLVTLRVTTVASKVKGGAHQLVFEKNGERLVVPVRKGTHTSRPITIPASFTSFRLSHTWKKGQVVLRSIRYTYSYQSLR